MRNPESNPDQRRILMYADNRELVEKKVAEYKSRYNSKKAPETQLDTVYKIAIGEAMLENGAADPEELAMQLTERYGKIDEKLFKQACVILNDYSQHAGKHLRHTPPGQTKG